jgi:hypothetical protein
VRASYARRQKEAGTRPVFQSSAAYEKTNVEVDVILGELNSRTTPAAVEPAEPIKRVQRLPE